MNSDTSQLYHINIKSRRPLSEGKTSRNVSMASFPPGHELCDALWGQRTVTISPFLANPGRPETDVPEAVRGNADVAYFPGILALLRAMASSTAFNCFSSSSRRERVLLGLAEPEPEAELEPDPAPGAGGLPADMAAGPFPEDLGGGDRGRFLNLKVGKEPNLVFYSVYFWTTRNCIPMWIYCVTGWPMETTTHSRDIQKSVIKEKVALSTFLLVVALAEALDLWIDPFWETAEAVLASSCLDLCKGEHLIKSHKSKEKERSIPQPHMQISFLISVYRRGISDGQQICFIVCVVYLCQVTALFSYWEGKGVALYQQESTSSYCLCRFAAGDRWKKNVTDP